MLSIKMLQQECMGEINRLKRGLYSTLFLFSLQPPYSIFLLELKLFA